VLSQRKKSHGTGKKSPPCPIAHPVRDLVRREKKTGRDNSRTSVRTRLRSRLIRRLAVGLKVKKNSHRNIAGPMLHATSRVENVPQDV
jgi:hypothetical protein